MASEKGRSIARPAHKEDQAGQAPEYVTVSVAGAPGPGCWGKTPRRSREQASAKRQGLSTDGIAGAAFIGQTGEGDGRRGGIPTASNPPPSFPETWGAAHRAWARRRKTGPGWRARSEYPGGNRGEG